MIDRPDNGVNTGLFGNGDPCNLAGIWERTPPVPHQPRSSMSRLALAFPVVGNRRAFGGAGGAAHPQESVVTQ